MAGTLGSRAESGLTLRTRLTSRGLVALVLGVLVLVAGLVLSYAGLVVLGVGLLLLIGFALAAVLLPAPVVPARRISPLRVQRNARCTATLQVRSGASRFGVSLDADEQIGARRVPVVVPRLGPGQQVEVEYQIPTHRRGLIEVGPLRLRRVGTAGLATAEGVVGGVVGVHVLPRVLPVLGLPGGVQRGQIGADERVERGGTDLLALREYVPGDDLRRVHWATSARSGTLMVREDADPANPYLTVLLDDRTESYTGDEFEDAVEVAASLVTTVVEAGHPIRLLSISGRVDVDVPSAPPGMLAPGSEDLLRELAGVTAVEGVTTAATIPTRDLDVVVVSTGAGAALDPLVAEAARAPLGVTCVVDRHDGGISARGTVVVLRGPRAEDILAAWDQAVGR